MNPESKIDENVAGELLRGHEQLLSIHRQDDSGGVMKKLRLILLLFVVAAPSLFSSEQGAHLDSYARLSTGLSFGGAQSLEYYDWTAGLDLGLGVQIGMFHAGAAAGIRTQALLILALALLVVGGVDSTNSDFELPEGDLRIYGDFPLRLYAGFTIERKSGVIQLDAFWGGYLRASNSEFPPAALDFEAGLTFSRKRFFVETSYLWPQTHKVRLSVGLQWGRSHP